MKTIILICCIALAFCSCKEKKHGLELYDVTNPVTLTVPNTPDTSIGQQVWYNKNGGKYVLQTWVNTNKYQAHYSNNREDEFKVYIVGLSGTGTVDAPYNVDIIGSFEYIKANKAIEYAKAVKVLDSLRIQGYAIQVVRSVEEKRQRAINDSVELLSRLTIIVVKVDTTSKPYTK